MAIIARNGCRYDCYMRIVGKGPPGLRATVFDLGWLAPGQRKALLDRAQSNGMNISDIQVDSGQMSTGVEILLKMSHKALTSSEEDIK